jgi:hypothetical protein
MRKGTFTVTEITFPELDKQLQELASVNWEKFVKLTGIDRVQVVICAEREKGRSLQQIANKLKKAGHPISRQAVGGRCKKCKPKPDTSSQNE